MPIHDWTRVNAGIFHDFHHEWISTIKRSLNAGLLPPGYYSMAEQIAGGWGPDVLTLESTPSKPSPTPKDPPPVGMALAAPRPPQVRFRAVGEKDLLTRKQKQVVVRHSSDHRVVAILEIVSPGNKSTRHAVQAFLEKANNLMERGVHLLIIDLFPPGPRDPQGLPGALWADLVSDPFQLPPGQPLSVGSFSAGLPFQAFVEVMGIGDNLPEMPLFLDGERYIQVPLEASYQAAWEAVPEVWKERVVVGS